MSNKNNRFTQLFNRLHTATTEAIRTAQKKASEAYRKLLNTIGFEQQSTHRNNGYTDAGMQIRYARKIRNNIAETLAFYRLRTIWTIVNPLPTTKILSYLTGIFKYAARKKEMPNNGQAIYDATTGTVLEQTKAPQTGTPKKHPEPA